ncbi:MAG: efflux RND transporter periplasmic adaptor subunit [Balneolia bacterium]|nr:efflux RND transporter periplasmic adaptor subunit [Balneolia bacterium]
MNIQLNKTTILLLSGVMLIGLLLGYLIFGGSGHGHDDHSGHSHEMTTDANGNEVWTCSMHPSVREDGPGICPICAMDLIPASASGEDEGDFAMVMSESAVRLAEIQTVAAERMVPEKEIRLPGRVVADERNLSSITAHFPGRITRLDVNFTGMEVRRGDVLATIYSPELVAAQRELLEAIRFEESNPGMTEAAKSKLRQWELSENEIERIIESGDVQREIAVTAPASGVVIQRNVARNDYVQTGTVMFEIADLSNVWLQFEVYEDDISWILRGDAITFATRSNPGTTYETIAEFVDPVLNEQNRTVAVRASYSNNEGNLRPGQILSGTLKAAYHGEPQVMIPASSVLWTGPRSVVYVHDTSADGFRFEAREVEIGARAGDFFAVHSGIEEGEHVVSNGAFKIDSEMQLSDRFSMMNRNVLAPEDPHEREIEDVSEGVSDEFRSEFTALVETYLDVKDALVESDFETASELTGEMVAQLEAIGEHRNDGDAHMLWMETYGNIEGHLSAAAEAGDIEALRGEFRFLSDLFVDAVKAFGIEGVVYQQYCPMAFDDEGGYWLSREDQIMNPYLPETMLMCGEVIERIE